MGLFFGYGGMIASGWKTAPTICESVQYNVEYSLDVEWKGRCVDTSITYGANKVFFVKRGDYIRISMTVKDAQGDLIDVSEFDEIEYVISTDVKAYPLVSKKKTDGSVVVGQNGSTVVIEVMSSDTSALPQTYCYHECRMTNGDEAQTVFSGYFKSPETLLGVI